jgi:prepilin-type processing-associated H-X9-DG protein
MPEANTNSEASRPWTRKAMGFGVFTVVAVLTIVGLSLMGGCGEHMKYHCGQQLRYLGVGCRMYATTHDGRLPSKWSELSEVEDGMAWDKLLCCPVSGHAAGSWAQADFWADYRLIPGRTTNDPPDTVLAIEPLSNHKTGANVLFVDGSSQWWPAKRVLGEKTLPSSARE